MARYGFKIAKGINVLEKHFIIKLISKKIEKKEGKIIVYMFSFFMKQEMKMSCYKNSTGTVIENIFNVFEKLNKEINILTNDQIHPPIQLT